MKLVVKDYILFLNIGHFQDEKKFSREVNISLEVDFLFDPKTFDDKLHNTLDYSQLLDFLEKKYTAQTFDLIETLIVKIAQDLILNFNLIQSLSIKVEKSFLSKKLSKNAKLSMERFFHKEDFI